MERPLEPAQPADFDVSPHQAQPFRLQPDAATEPDPSPSPASHAPPPTDIKAIVAGWIAQRYREQGQPVAINAQFLRQEIQQAGFQVGRDRLYRVLDELTAKGGGFKRQRIDRVYRYEPAR